MSLQDVPADDADRWVRHLIEPNSLKNNRITEAYIRRYLEPVSNRPWQAEISGRLLSLAFDWRSVAAREVRRIGQDHFRFRGMAYVDVATLRTASQNFDVLRSGTFLDWAHANLVAWNAPLAEADPGVIVRPRVSADVTRSLAGILTVVILQHQLDALEQRRVPIDATSPATRCIRTVCNVAIFVYRFSCRRLMEQIKSAQARFH